MLWLLWCYFGLVSIQTSNSQRRALVDYPLKSSSKPNFTNAPTTTSSPGRQKEPWNSTELNSVHANRSPVVTGGSRGDSSAKENFDSRERTRGDDNNNTANRSKGTVSSVVSSGSEGDRLAVILSGQEEASNRERYEKGRRNEDSESISIRGVSSSAPENKVPVASKESSSRVDEKSPASRPKTDYDDRRVLDPIPLRDDDTSRSRRPVDRVPYDDDRPIRRTDDYDRDRIPVREYEEEKLERGRRPVDTVGRRRDTYETDDDLPRSWYDSLDDRDYDRTPTRKGDSGERLRIPDSRRDPEYDRPRVRDDRYREEVDDGRRRVEVDRRRDDRYRYDDLDDDRYKYRSRPVDESRLPDDRSRSRLPDDRYRRQDEEDRRPERRYPVRSPEDDEGYRTRAKPVSRDEDIRPPIRDPPRRIVEPYDDRRPVSVARDPLDDRVIPSSRRRDDYDTEKRLLASRPTDRDDTVVKTPDRYTERIRGDERPDDYRSDERDLPPRPRYDTVEDKDTRRTPVVSDDPYRYRKTDSDMDKGYRRRDYDDDEISGPRLSKGDERLLDRDRPVYITEDKDLSRSLSPKSDVTLDRRSHSSSDDDYVRNRPRVDPDDDIYRPPSRRSGDPDVRYRPDEEGYVSRSRDRLDGDYRSKGDYGRDRDDRYEESSGDRRYLRKDEPYEDDRRYPSDTRSGDRRLPASRVVDDERPVRRPLVDRLPPRDNDRYDTDSRPPPRPRVDDYRDEYKGRDPDRYSDSSSSRSRTRDTVRPVIREKRFEDPPQPCSRRDRTGDDGDCEPEAIRSPSNSRKPPADRNDERSTNPLSPKDVIEAAYKLKDVTDRPREVVYPVYDPRIGNITTTELIRPGERRGTVITSRRKRK